MRSRVNLSVTKNLDFGNAALMANLMADLEPTSLSGLSLTNAGAAPTIELYSWRRKIKTSFPQPSGSPLGCEVLGLFSWAAF